MDNLRIYPYNMSSTAAKELARVLNSQRVYPDGAYTPKAGQVVLNWGNSQQPDWAFTAYKRGVIMLNKCSKIAVAANKLKTFQALSAQGVNVPAFTTDQNIAQTWANSGMMVVERHSLTGHSGEGIKIVGIETQRVSPAPLYVKYVHKTAEYRVHVFRGQVIDVIQKKMRRGAEQEPNFHPYVYSANHGWVFTRDNVVPPTGMNEMAVKAISALGLDFGAVDIVETPGELFVLEVNTAPGLEGTTLHKYVQAISNFMGVPVPDYVPGQVVRVTAQSSVPSSTVTMTLDRQVAIQLKELLNRVVS